jgi:hypothetical protein
MCILVCVCYPRIHALSLMFFKLLTSRHPFQEMFEKTPYAVMFAVSQGQRPPRPEHSDCLLGPTDDMWILIKDCWQQEPGARPEMNTVHQRLQSVLNQGRDIQDKCDELLKLAHSVPPEVEISSHFIALLQDIWSDVRGRDCLLHADRAAAERLMEVAQRVCARVRCATAPTDRVTTALGHSEWSRRLPPWCALYAHQAQHSQQPHSCLAIRGGDTSACFCRYGWGPLCGHLQRSSGSAEGGHQAHASLLSG